MKKSCLLIVSLLIILILCACGKADTKVPEEAEKSDKGEEIVSEENYSVFEEDGPEGKRYYYEIKANDGTVMENVYTHDKPVISERDKNIYSVLFFTDGKYFCRYYNVDTKEMTESFSRVFWDNGKVLARQNFAGDRSIVVQSIFDDSYCEETLIDCIMSQFTVLAASLSEDGKTLNVTYIPGNGGDVGFTETDVAVPLP